MALDFDGSSQYMTRAGVVTSKPFTVAAMIRPDVVAVQSIFGVISTEEVNNWSRVWIGRVEPPGPEVEIRIVAQDRGGSLGGTTINSIAQGIPGGTGEWMLVAGRFVSNFARRAFGMVMGDLSSKVTAVTAGTVSVDLGAPNQVACAHPKTPTAQEFNGQMGWVTVWDVDVDFPLLEQIGMGAHPLKIRPADIVACYPLWGIHGTAAARDLSPNGSTFTLVGSPGKAATGPPVVPFSTLFGGWGSFPHVPSGVSVLDYERKFRGQSRGVVRGGV